MDGKQTIDRHDSGLKLKTSPDVTNLVSFHFFPIDIYNPIHRLTSRRHAIHSDQKPIQAPSVPKRYCYSSKAEASGLIGNHLQNIKLGSYFALITCNLR